MGPPDADPDEYGCEEDTVAGWPRLLGMGTLSASAIAAVIAAALEKRAFGSLARAVMITFARAGGILGLMRAGGVGME